MALFMAGCSFASVNAQLIEPEYNYGSEEYAHSNRVFDEGLLRMSEFRVLSMIKNYKDAPANDRAILLRADIDLISGNYNIALGQIAEFIKERHNSPLVPYAHLWRAYIEFERKKYQQADEYFAQAERAAVLDYTQRNDSSYIKLAHTATYWRAVSIANQGKYQDAMPAFEAVNEKYPGGEFSDDAIYALGTIAESDMNYALSAKQYRHLQKNYPYGNCLLGSYIREANNHILLRDAGSALVALERAETIYSHITTQDSNANLYETQSYTVNTQEYVLYLRGEAYNLAGNYDKALESFNQFLDTFKTSVLINSVRLGAGWAYLNKADYQNAIAQYDGVIQTEEDDNSKLKASAQLYRAVAVKRSGDMVNARKELSALALQSAYPFQGLVLLELGQLNYEDGDFPAARKNLERAEREAVDAKASVRIQLLLGAVYMELKFWDKAVNTYQKAEKLALNSDELFLPNKKWYLAEARLKQGISLVNSLRSAEAIKPLLAFTAASKDDERISEAYFWLGEAYYRSDMLNNAIETYSQILEKYPQSPRREESLYGLGWSYFRLKNFDRSSKVFDQMIKEFPKTAYGVEVLTRQGDGYYLNKNYNAAADAYRKAANLAPNTEEGQYSAYQLCHALYRQSKYEQSITALLSFAKSYQSSPFTPNALYLIGWIRFQQNKYAEAIDNFRFLINTYPQSDLSPRAHFAIADCFYNLGNYEEAISGYKMIVEKFPSHDLAPEAMKGVQYALMALGRDAEALEIADKYIESNPNSPFVSDFKYKKAEMFYTGRKYQDAIAEFKNFSDKYPDSEKNAEALYWMGKSYLNMNEIPSAERTFSDLTRKFPKSDYAPLGLLEYGIMLKDNNNFKSADSILKVLQVQYPEHQTASQAGYERAMMKLNSQDTVGAIATFKQIAKDYPTMDYGDQSRYQVAMYYRSKEMYDSSRAEFAILAQIEENPIIAAEAQYRIGELYMREKDFEKAANSFSVVKDNFSGVEDWYSLSLLNLGECYEQQERFELAKEIYSVLDALRPEDDFGKTAKARLKRIK